MALKLHQLQAAFARRREVEHQRVERTAEVNRYYDHWGKVTTRFENWTTPEYYKQADDKLKQRKEKKDRAQQLDGRRAKLKELYSSERNIYEVEMREREKMKFRKKIVDNDTLEKIDRNVKERENIKRKLELEAKLYGRWRHGVEDENLIFESKSDNQVLAKLNWLDKQVEDQIEREKEEVEAQKRNLRLQEEINKTVQVQKERQQIREQEIKEIRALQESHMEKLKERQRESDMLKEEEAHIRGSLDDLEKELDLLIESSAGVLEPAELSQAYNLKKIKVFIRKRCDVFRNQIKLLIELLERVKPNAINKEKVNALLKQYKEEYEAESLMLSQIEAMYESEAKYNLARCEDQWQSQHLERYHELQKLIKDEQCALSARLNDNLEQQTNIIKMRSTHLESIENSNEKLKQLFKEQEDSPRLTVDNVESTSVTKPSISGTSVPSLALNRPQSALPKLTNSFTNLNLDVWQDLPPSARGGIDSPRLLSQRSVHVVTPDNVERPRFARKRVAWT